MEVLREYSSDSDSAEAFVQQLQINNTGFSRIAKLIKLYFQHGKSSSEINITKYLKRQCSNGNSHLL